MKVSHFSMTQFFVRFLHFKWNVPEKKKNDGHWYPTPHTMAPFFQHIPKKGHCGLQLWYSHGHELSYSKVVLFVFRTQCANFWIFLSLRFYVKSILRPLEIQKVPFFSILVALNFVKFVVSTFKK